MIPEGPIQIISAAVSRIELRVIRKVACWYFHINKHRPVDTFNSLVIYSLHTPFLLEFHAQIC